MVVFSACRRNRTVEGGTNGRHPRGRTPVLHWVDASGRDGGLEMAEDASSTGADVGFGPRSFGLSGRQPVLWQRCLLCELAD